MKAVKMALNEVVTHASLIGAHVAQNFASRTKTASKAAKRSKPNNLG